MPEEKSKVERFYEGYPKTDGFKLSEWLKQFKFMERAKKKGQEAKEDRENRDPNAYERAGQNQGDSGSL